MKRALVALLTLAVALLAAIPATAITGNFVPDFRHPYVGLIAFYDASNTFLGRCSGALLSPTIFLTAGHCTAIKGATNAVIWFDQDVGSEFNPATPNVPDPRTGYPIGCVTNDPLCFTSTQLFNFNYPQNDVGLVILSQPATIIGTYAVLAAPGSLDQLGPGLRTGVKPTVTISGYGISDVRPVQVSFRERLMATAFVINVRNAITRAGYVQISDNPGGARGGGCFGDSGGPILWDNTDTVIAVESFGLNANCAGVEFDFRVDTQAVYDWITQVTGVTLPTQPITQ